MLPDALDPKGLTVRAHGDDELVVRDLGDGPLGDLRRLDLDILAPVARPRLGRGQDGLADQPVGVVLLHVDDLALPVDIVGPPLPEGHVAAQPPDGLERRAELERPHGGGREQRREDEVAPRRDHDAFVLGGVEGPREGVAGPTCGNWLF